MISVQCLYTTQSSITLLLQPFAFANFINYRSYSEHTFIDQVPLEFQLTFACLVLKRFIKSAEPEF